MDKQKQPSSAESSASASCPLSPRELRDLKTASAVIAGIYETQERDQFLTDICLINVTAALNRACRGKYTYDPKSRFVEKWKRLSRGPKEKVLPGVISEETKRIEAEIQEAHRMRDEAREELRRLKEEIEARRKNRTPESAL